MLKGKYKVGNKRFHTKQDIIEYIQYEIHKKYPDGKKFSKSHLAFMYSLLENHPSAEIKIGCGVKSMWLGKAPNFPSKCFWLERVDGTKTDFSFYQCIIPSSPITDFQKACRYAIKDTTIAFKQKFFEENKEPVCSELDIPLTYQNSHVDHIPPNTFYELVHKFIKLYKINVNKVELSTNEDQCTGTMFRDKTLEEFWKNYHDSNCSLRVISAEANLTAEKSQRYD